MPIDQPRAGGSPEVTDGTPHDLDAAKPPLWLVVGPTGRKRYEGTDEQSAVFWFKKAKGDGEHATLYRAGPWETVDVC